MNLAKEFPIQQRYSKPQKIHDSDGVNKIYLSKRENECLVYLVRGLTAKETSRQMGISNRTVEEHINRIKNKMGVHKKLEIIANAFKLGLITF